MTRQKNADKKFKRIYDLMKEVYPQCPFILSVEDKNDLVNNDSYIVWSTHYGNFKDCIYLIKNIEHCLFKNRDKQIAEHLKDE